MKFIHAADLHVDSPLKGLERYEGAPVERMRRATRDACENVISLAIDERVDFVVIAGDLFDGKWPDMQTGLWTAGQFRRLEREGIPVYLLRGNHDAASEVQQRMAWPANVREFGVDVPETFRLDELGVALHGQGFARRAVPEDLAAGYPEPVSGWFNIGVLHTSLTGDPEHDTYAPTSQDALALRGYDYWALGHVHARREVREEPRIVFAGNTQGRHVNETGAKGCYVVTVEQGRLVEARFEPTDVLRWYSIDVEAKSADDVETLVDRVRERIEECRALAMGRYAAVRINIAGPCGCHGKLVDRQGEAEVIAEIRDFANRSGDVWIERVRFRTTAPVDLARLRTGADLVGELLRDLERWAEAGDDELHELAESLESLKSKPGAESELAEAELLLDDPVRLRGWVKQAEGILSTLLVMEEES